MQKSPKFTIMNLQPLTVYCVEARVHSFASWNKSSNFSDRQCEKTGAGEHLLDVLNGAWVDKVLHWDWWRISPLLPVAENVLPQPQESKVNPASPLRPGTLSLPVPVTLFHSARSHCLSLLTPRCSHSDNRLQSLLADKQPGHSLVVFHFLVFNNL